ncbi:MAG: protein kinase, partial [Planctomycetales bacterium]|nr:protein kinase [Planctomycetales bacterium]
MDTKSYDLAGRIFLEATGVSSEEREELVRRRVGSDDELFDVVIKMLQFDSPDYLVEPAVETRTDEQTPASREEPIGAVDELGDYKIIEPIGRGGMGVVYRARQRSLNRIVALKVIRSSLLATNSDVRRFRFEAEAASELEHPAIVPIYQIGQEEGYHFYSMKLVEGSALDLWAAQAKPSLRQRVQLAAQLADAIHHAHQRGVIHRDLKPANVLVDCESAPHVIDFGIARRVDTDSNLTSTGQLLGTPNYMAPELLGRSKQRPTFAADIYGIGALLYELLTDTPPFESSSIIETLHRVAESEPTNPRTLNSAVDRDLHAIVLKCLEKLPERRYDSAAALAEDLQNWLKGTTVSARPVSSTQRLFKWTRRRPIIVALLGTIVLVTTLGFVGTLWQWRAAVKANNDYLAAVVAARQAEAEAKQLAVAEHAAREESQLRSVALCLREAERFYESKLAGNSLAWCVEAIRVRGDRTESTVQVADRMTPVEALRLERWAELQPELLALWTFPSEVIASAIPASGEWLVAATAEDGTYICPLRDAGRETVDAFKLTQALGSIACSDDSRYAVGVSNQAEFVAIDLQNLTVATPVIGEIASVAFCFEPRSHNTLLASTNGEIHRVDLDEPTNSELLLRREGLIDLVCSPSGTTFAIVEPHVATLWDTATLELIGEVPLSARKPVVSFSPDGNTFLATSDQSSYSASVVGYDTRSGERVSEFQCDGQINDVCYLDGEPVTGDFSHAVRVWKTKQDGAKSEVLRHGSSIVDVESTGGGSLLATSEFNGSLHLYSVEPKLRELFSLNLPELAQQIEFHPSEDSIFATVADTISRWSTKPAGPSLIQVPDTGDRFSPREPSADGRLLVVTQPNVAQWVSLTDGSLSPEKLAHSDRVLFAKVVAEDRIVTGDQIGKCCVWDTEDLSRPIRQFDFGTALIRCDPTPLANVFAVQRIDGNLVMLDIRDGGLVCPDIPLQDRRDNVVLIESRPGHEQLPPHLLTRLQGRQWSLESGESIGMLADGAGINAALFDHVANEVIVGTSGGRIERRNAVTGTLVDGTSAHQAPVYRLAWSPLADRFASCSGDGTAVVWTTRPQLRKLLAVSHGDRVRAIEFSRDGSILLTGSFDGTVQIWDAENGTRIGPPIDVGNRVHLAQFSTGGDAIFINREPFTSQVYRLPIAATSREQVF